MTNAEMHPIEVHDVPVLLKRTLAPSFKLLRECLIEATDRAGTGSDAQQRLGHVPHFMRTRAGHEHLGESFGNVRFITIVALEDLRVELTFPIAGNLEIFDTASRCGQVAAIGAIAIASALGV